MKALTTVLIFLTMQATGQPANLPAGAEAFYNKAMPAIKPDYKTLVTQSAIALRNRPVNIDSLTTAFRANAKLTSLSQLEITALVQLVLTQNAKDAEVDMQSDLQSMQAVNKMRQQQRTIEGATPEQKARFDSIRKLQERSNNTMVQDHQKQLKTEHDRSAKMMNALATLVKKTNPSQDAIINNLK